MRRSIFTILFIGFSILAVSQDAKVLFVGNSLTYTNNLPKLFKEEAERLGLTVATEMLAYPNYAVIDHWEDGELQKRIANGSYDFIVVQQGPSSQQEGRVLLIEAGKLISNLCAQHGCKLAYFMVWPSSSYYHTFSGVIKNHQDAASLNNALLCPVGEAWKIKSDEGDFSYYGADGFHPSVKGSRLAARIIAQTLLVTKK